MSVHEQTKLDPRAVACRDALQTYWTEQGLWFDCKWWTPQEWEDRGEPYGEQALLNLTMEGGLKHELNYGWESRPPFAVQERSTEICYEHGLWFELGYAWSLHLYALPPSRLTVAVAAGQCPGDDR